MAICLERGANDLHMVQLMPLPPRHLLLQQNPQWFILLVPANAGCPRNKASNVCVCVCGGQRGHFRVKIGYMYQVFANFFVDINVEDGKLCRLSTYTT